MISWFLSSQTVQSELQVEGWVSSIMSVLFWSLKLQPGEKKKSAFFVKNMFDIGSQVLLSILGSLLHVPDASYFHVEIYLALYASLNSFPS